MKQITSLFPVAMVASVLILSQTVYGQPPEYELTAGDITHNPLDNYYTSTLNIPSVELAENGEEHMIVLVIPLGVRIDRALMELGSPDEEPPDVAIFLGSSDGEPIVTFDGEFEEFYFTEELNDFIEEYLETNPKGEDYKIRVPFVFASQSGGTIEFELFTIRYEVNAVEGMKVVFDPSTEKPTYFFWNAGTGKNPGYEIQIRSVTESSEEVLISESCVCPFYVVPEEQTPVLEPIEPGRIYSWRVRVIYDFGRSRWTPDEFTIRQEPVPVVNIQPRSGLEGTLITQEEIRFSWDYLGDADYYIIALNGHEFVEKPDKPSFDIGKNNEHLCHCGENTLTVWAFVEGQKSEPTYYSFQLDMEQLPAPDTLIPSSGVMKKKEFTFNWTSKVGIREFKFRIYNSRSPKDYLLIPMRTEDLIGEDTEITVSCCSYNPWNEAEYEEKAGLDLMPGQTYIWEVQSWPSSGDPDCASDWTASLIYYDPIGLGILIFLAALGGLVGGFILVVKAEQSRKAEKDRLRIPLDQQTLLGFIIGIIVGVIFFILASRSGILSGYLNQLNIYPYDKFGSFVLGIIGGLISLGITRLPGVLPKPSGE